MKNKKVLTLIFGLVFVITLSLCFAFDWPQVVENSKVFSSFFGQPRGSAYTNSLIFENPAEIFPAEKGTVLITLETGISDMGWFDSTLGNAVILSHSNDMLTVYGNMDEISLKYDMTDVTQEMKLGMSGTSGWQKGKNCLEFQVVDTKSKNLINPLRIKNKRSLLKRRRRHLIRAVIFRRWQMRNLMFSSVPPTVTMRFSSDLCTLHWVKETQLTL
jgi:murein DD-endopeptidase MepM/ murein hydrolase activator NlpD